MVTSFDMLNEHDYEKMASEIEALSAQSEAQLYELIGNALYDSGLSVATVPGDFGFLQPVMYNPAVERFSVARVADFVMNTKPLPKPDAQSRGKILLEKVKKAICEDAAIAALFSDNNKTLKEILKVLLPFIAKVLKISSFNPVVMAIIVAIAAFILKIGYKMYCEVPSAAPVSTDGN